MPPSADRADQEAITWRASRSPGRFLWAGAVVTAVLGWGWAVWSAATSAASVEQALALALPVAPFTVAVVVAVIAGAGEFARWRATVHTAVFTRDHVVLVSPTGRRVLAVGDLSRVVVRHDEDPPRTAVVLTLAGGPGPEHVVVRGDRDPVLARVLGSVLGRPVEESGRV